MKKNNISDNNNIQIVNYDESYFFILARRVLRRD